VAGSGTCTILNCACICGQYRGCNDPMYHKYTTSSTTKCCLHMDGILVCRTCIYEKCHYSHVRTMSTFLHVDRTTHQRLNGLGPVASRNGVQPDALAYATLMLVAGSAGKLDVVEGLLTDMEMDGLLPSQVCNFCKNTASVSCPAVLNCVTS
jgi:hypothetical protein